MFYDWINTIVNLVCGTFYDYYTPHKRDCNRDPHLPLST